MRAILWIIWLVRQKSEKYIHTDNIFSTEEYLKLKIIYHFCTVLHSRQVFLGQNSNSILRKAVSIEKRLAITLCFLVTEDFYQFAITAHVFN